MASWAINQLTAPDKYGTNADTGCLDQLPILDHINLDVVNQGIYWQIKQATAMDPRGSGAWNSEVYMTPGSRVIQRVGVVGIRIRAAVPKSQLPAGTSQAVVTVEAVES